MITSIILAANSSISEEFAIQANQSSTPGHVTLIHGNYIFTGGSKFLIPGR